MNYRTRRKRTNILTGFSVCGATESVPDYIKLWILRILLKLGGHREFLQGKYFREDRLAQIIGLGRWVDSELDFDTKKIMMEMHKIYASDEDNLESLLTDHVLISNVEKIAAIAGLSQVDCRILEFTILLRAQRVRSSHATFKMAQNE